MFTWPFTEWFSKAVSVSQQSGMEIVEDRGVAGRLVWGVFNLLCFVSIPVLLVVMKGYMVLSSRYRSLYGLAVAYRFSNHVTSSSLNGLRCLYSDLF